MACAGAWCKGIAIVGLMISSAVAGAGARPWVLPDQHLGRHTAPLLILSRPEVQADLKLEAKHIDELDQTISDLYFQAQAIKGRRDPEAVAIRRAIDESHRKWLESHLTEAQRSRLVQLDLQWEGPAALHTRPLVADSLRITESQKSKLTSAYSDRERKRAIAGRDSHADDLAFAEAVLSVLDEDQKGRWKSMLGHPCHFKTALK